MSSHALLRRLALSSVAVACLASSAPAWGQAPAANPQNGVTALDDVVVTARRREENVQDIPIAVSAFSEEKLQALDVKGPQDLSKLSPGLQLTHSNGIRNAFLPFIRGQGVSSTGDGGSGVIPYFAEAPNFDTSFYDLQNLQVVKGPQGTLFGETATGGVLLFVPRKPSNAFSGYLRAGVGNYEQRFVEGAIGGALIEDKVMVRFAGQIRQREGFTTAYSSHPGVPPKMFDDVDRAEWRASVVLRPFENLENYTVVVHNDIKSNGQAQLAYAAMDRKGAIQNLPPGSIPSMAIPFEYYSGYAPPPGRTWLELQQDAVANQAALGIRATTTNYDHFRETKFTGLVNHTTWNVTDHLLVKNVFSLQQTLSKGPILETDASSLPLLDTRAQTILPGVSPSDGFTRGPKTWTNETQIQGDLFGERLTYQGGAYFRRIPETEAWGSGDGTIILATIALNNPLPAARCLQLANTPVCSRLTRSRSESEAVYAQGTFAVTPTLNLTAGYRRTWDERQTQETAGTFYSTTFKGMVIPLSVLGNKPLPGAGIATTSLPRTSADTYTLAADWQITDDILVYATHRKGYKAGGINGNTPLNDPQRVYGPEQVKDVEFGLKADFEVGGAKVRTNIAVFRDWYDDIQRATLLPDTAQTVIRNLASATIQGVEVEFNVQPSPYFELGGYFAYTDAKFEEWMELATCGAQAFQPVCTGAPASALLTVDHAKGRASANGATSTFEPDYLAGVSKYRWGVQPAVHLGFLSPALENATLSANIYYRSESTVSDANNSQYVNRLNIIEPYTLADLRFDWRKVRDSGFDIFVNVTNVTDSKARTFVGDASSICNCFQALYAEPRFWYVGFNYEF